MRVALTAGAYQSRSLTADAQKTINLYPEKNPDDSPFPFTYYPTPGLTPVGPGINPQLPGRGLYTATNGDLYAVLGPNLYYLDPTFTPTYIGSFTYTGGNTPSTPMSMSDNGLVLCLVDGTAKGYSVTLAGRTWNGQISDAAFLGATKVDYVDTYFLFNQPGTANFYVSPSNWTPGTPFNPLWIAGKTGSPDPIQTLIVMHLEPWLLGSNTSEVWYDSGSADFPLGRFPGVFIEHGCVAPYSVAKEDLSIFWLSEDRQGQRIVLQGEGYQAKRVSNFGLEAALAGYGMVSDAIGMTYQQEGHVFYVLTFPTADATWVYDVSNGLWHQRAWLDNQGALHRHRACSIAAAYGVVVCQDWQTGQIYKLDQNAWTDNGQPILRLQTFPHLRKDSKRVSYSQFIADMEVGTVTTVQQSSDVSFENITFTGSGPIQFTGNAGNVNFGSPGSSPYEPKVSLRWSDDGGYSWGQPVERGLGSQGQYNTTPTWWRTGMARRRVYELSWSHPYETVLNGAYVEAEAAET